MRFPCRLPANATVVTVAGSQIIPWLRVLDGSLVGTTQVIEVCQKRA